MTVSVVRRAVVFLAAWALLLAASRAEAQLDPMQVYGEVSQAGYDTTEAGFLYANRDALWSVLKAEETDLFNRWQEVKHLASPAQKEYFDNYDWLVLLELGAARTSLNTSLSFLLTAQLDYADAAAAWGQSWNGTDWVQAQLQIAHTKALSSSTNALASKAETEVAWSHLSPAGGYLELLEDVVENVEALDD